MKREKIFKLGYFNKELIEELEKQEKEKLKQESLKIDRRNVRRRKTKLKSDKKYKFKKYNVNQNTRKTLSEKLSRIHKGKILSEETKLKISNGLDKFHNNNTFDNQIGLIKPAHDTKPEKIFEKLLNDRGLIVDIDYKKQFKVSYYYADFFLLKQNLIVEIYGCYWHQCAQCGFDKGYNGKTASEIRQRDQERNDKISSKGYNIKIIWEHQLYKIFSKEN